MLFPKQKSTKTFTQTNMIVYGWPKTGKTTFSSCLKAGDKEPLFIMTEDGQGVLEISKARVKDWGGFTKLVELLDSKSKDIQEQHSCLVIDLVSDLDNWCGEWVAKQNQVSHISDLDYGKGFSLQKEEFRKAMSRLMAILPCCFVAHTNDKEVEVQGRKVKVQAPNLSKGALEFINGKVDTVAFIKPNNGEVKGALVISPSLMAITGSRYKSIIGEHPFDGSNAKELIKNLETKFNKEA